MNLESNGMSQLDEQFEDLYGPMPAYSDYKKGERVTYRYGGQVLTGTIVWISGPEVIADKHYPTCYIIECDTEGGIPHHVHLGEIIAE